jgi:phage terminase small subunit
MKFKSFIDSDIEDFRKLNISIVEKSKDELVSKIQEKYGIKNEVIGIMDDINILLGRKAKVGFTTEADSVEKKIKRLNKKKIEAIKIKLFESNSFLTEMKKELERKLSEGDN